MSNLKFVHSGGNSVSLTTPTSNPGSNVTFKLPAADGSANEVLKPDGSGNLSFVAQPTGGLSNVVQFRTTQHQQQDNGDQYEVLIHWEKTDNTDAGQIGSFSNPSTGVFTFPSTGIYLVTINANFEESGSGGHNYAGFYLKYTTNNSSYITGSFGGNNIAALGGSTFGFVSVNFTFDVTDVSTHKIRFHTIASGAGMVVAGASSYNTFWAEFTRLGDT